MDVIDLCAGDGWFTLQIARIAAHVIAIDIDRRLLDVARLRLTESGLRNCDYVEGAAYDVARLAPRPADFVFMANAFHGVPDRPRLARAVHAALRPGGRFAIVNWHQRPREQTTVLDGHGRHVFPPENPQSAELTDAAISFRRAAALPSDVHGNN